MHAHEQGVCAVDAFGAGVAGERGRGHLGGRRGDPPGRGAGVHQQGRGRGQGRGGGSGGGSGSGHGAGAYREDGGGGAIGGVSADELQPVTELAKQLDK